MLTSNIVIARFWKCPMYYITKRVDYLIPPPGFLSFKIIINIKDKLLDPPPKAQLAHRREMPAELCRKVSQQSTKSGTKIGMHHF